MASSRHSPTIHVMVNAAQKAARGLVRDFGEVEQLQVSRKGPADFVSAADLRSEKIIREELEHARPKFGFLMEESGAHDGEDEEHRWIVDPLDGTSNFLHGIPHWAISIALEKGDEIVAGVIYDPVKDEMFWAEKGAGAFMNSRRLRVSGRNNMEDAVIAMGTPALTRGDHDQFIAQLMPVMAATAGTRRLGAAALDLAYVAAGRFEGFWEYGLNPWDVAAGAILMREAGGYMTEADGGRNPVYGGSVLAANTALHADLLKLIKSDKTGDAALKA